MTAFTLIQMSQTNKARFVRFNRTKPAKCEHTQLSLDSLFMRIPTKSTPRHNRARVSGGDTLQDSGLMDGNGEVLWAGQDERFLIGARDTLNGS